MPALCSPLMNAVIARLFKELLAVVKFTRQFRHYLSGRKFTVRRDHHSLTWLVNFRHPKGQIARWLEELSTT